MVLFSRFGINAHEFQLSNLSPHLVVWVDEPFFPTGAYIAERAFPSTPGHLEAEGHGNTERAATRRNTEFHLVLTATALFTRVLEEPRTGLISFHFFRS